MDKEQSKQVLIKHNKWLKKARRRNAMRYKGGWESVMNLERQGYDRITKLEEWCD